MVFHSSCTPYILTKVPTSLYPHQLLLSPFFVTAILIGVKVVTHCSSNLHFPKD